MEKLNMFEQMFANTSVGISGMSTIFKDTFSSRHTQRTFQE
jgi:hypothetical protein